jgi:hypothetical protein
MKNLQIKRLYANYVTIIAISRKIREAYAGSGKIKVGTLYTGL